MDKIVNSGASIDQPATVHFRLYIAGDTPNSRRAVANLKMICQRYLNDRSKVDYVDVWLEPTQAFKDGILVTPTLRRLHPRPEVNIIGDLSDMQAVLLALDITSQ
jgi:circadian clock protein KaiB